MAQQQKTVPSNISVDEYLSTVSDADRRKDCQTLIDLMQDITRCPPVMWGSIVGFGRYHYQYPSGRQGDAALTSFAARKKDLTIYIADGFDAYQDLLARLGKFKHSVSCLYVKRLADIDLLVLRELITKSVSKVRESYPS